MPSKTHHAHYQAEDSQLIVELLKDRILTLEQQLIKKCNYRFSFERLKKKTLKSQTQLQGRKPRIQ